MKKTTKRLAVPQPLLKDQIISKESYSSDFISVSMYFNIVFLGILLVFIRTGELRNGNFAICNFARVSEQV